MAAMQPKGKAPCGVCHGHMDGGHSSFLFRPASAETGRTIRVALLPQEGIAGQSESGSWSGTVIDFLDEISNYTGWQYEYIQVTQRELEASGAGNSSTWWEESANFRNWRGSLCFLPALWDITRRFWSPSGTTPPSFPLKKTAFREKPSAYTKKTRSWRKA